MTSGSSLATVDHLRQIAVNTTPPGVTEEHLRRLTEVLGRRDYRNRHNTLERKIAEGGFPWGVELQKLLKEFPYAAVLACPNDCDPERLVSNFHRGLLTDSGSALVYVGEVPDFALAHIQRAKELGVLYFTIHSREPLPVQDFLARIDPVVVGWTTEPKIQADKNNVVKGTTGDPHNIGSVIAVWDVEKELSMASD